MRAQLIAFALVVACPTGAFAACQSLPDDASSSYIENQQALALCRQRELSDRLAVQQRQVEIQGQINWLDTQIRLNEQFSRAQQALPQF